MTGLKPHTVEEIMTSPVVIVPASMSIEDALHLMREKKIHSVVVEPESTWGRLWHHDSARCAAQDRRRRSASVPCDRERSDVLALITVSPDTTIKQCSIIMLDANISSRGGDERRSARRHCQRHRHFPVCGRARLGTRLMRHPAR